MKAKMIGAIMVLMAGYLPSFAAPCHQQQVVVQKHVQAEIVYPAQVVREVTVVLPVYGIVPLHASHSYSPALVAPQEDRLDRIERLMLQMMEQKMGQSAMPLKVQKSIDCQGCHSGDGKTDAPKMDFSALTPQQKALSAKRIFDGTMPPKSKLSPEERLSVSAELLK